MAKTDVFGLEELRAELAQGIFHPLYALHGEEELLREEAAELIISRALTQEERGLSLDVLRGGEADVQEVVARASSFPMLAARRVVLVKDADRLRPSEPLAAYAAAPSPQTVLILSAEKFDLRKKPFAGGFPGGRLVAFPPLSADRIPAWVTARAAALGRTITPAAAGLLAASGSGLLRELVRELEKLLLFVGDRELIEEADVAGLSGFSREFTVPELTRALGARDTSRALVILDRMLEMGESGPGIVFMLTRYFSNLWRLQDIRKRQPHANEWTQRSTARIWKDEWEPLRASLRAFTPAEIEGAFPVLTTADELLKSSGTDARAVLEAMIVRLSAPGAVLH